MKLFLILILIVPSMVQCQNKKVENSLFVSYGGSCFTNSIADSAIEFYCFKQNYGFAIGFQRNYVVADRHNINLNASLSHFKSTYYFYDIKYNSKVYFKKSIYYSNLTIYPKYAFDIKKWFQIDVGAGVNLVLNNTFTDHSIGHYISWIDANNKSRMRTIYPTYSLGFQFRITERMSINFNYQKSIVPVIKLNINNNGYSIQSKHWQETQLLSLLYKI
jgi:opacity protein-like surface antigen